MSEDMRELEVPEAARHALRDHDSENFYDHDEDADQFIQSIARPVVAVELRRIADAWAASYDECPPEVAELINDLVSRAAVLRG